MRIFQTAIRRIVRSGDIVLDCNTRTGIMAILAAKEGAKTVIARSKSHDIVLENVENSGFANIIKIKNDYDICQADVVIADMLDALLVGDQVKTINSLINKGIITKRTSVIPRSASCFFEPVFYDFEFFDCHLPMIVAGRNFEANERCLEVLGSAVCYNEVDFRDKISLRCDYHGRHMIQTKGWFNALKFSIVVHMTEGLIIGSTSDFCMPVYVPVHQTLVKPGEIIEIRIQYNLSGGYEGLKIAVN